MNFWDLPDFGRRYNTLRLSKNRQVATYGKYTLEAVVSRIESKNPGLINEKILKEIINNVFRREDMKDKIMNLLIEDLVMSREEFWRNEAPPKNKPAAVIHVPGGNPPIPAPKLVKEPAVIQQPKQANTVPAPKAENTTQPRNKKKHLKITSHIADYSFIFVFGDGKIDIYEDKKECMDRTKEGVWIPPADLKYGSKLAPRTIEVDVVI